MCKPWRSSIAFMPFSLQNGKTMRDHAGIYTYSVNNCGYSLKVFINFSSWNLYNRIDRYRNQVRQERGRKLPISRGSPICWAVQLSLKVVWYPQYGPKSFFKYGEERSVVCHCTQEEKLNFQSFTQNGCYGNQTQPFEVVFYSIDANTSCSYTKQNLTVK